MTPKLKLPGTKRLKLRCDVLLSSFAFNSNLRRYTKGEKPVLGDKLAARMQKIINGTARRID
jgi:hypothetical protein